MKTKIKPCSYILFFMLSFMFLSFAPIAAQSEDTEETIVGTVVAVEWDDDGNATTVAISVEIIDEENENEEIDEYYLVGDTEKGYELLNYVGEDVEAKGTIKANEDGNKTIYVTDYKIVESEPEVEPDEEPDMEEESPYRN